MNGGASDGNIAHGALLTRYAEAIVTGADDAATVRVELLDTMGAAALVDSAAVVALFNAIDRVADATGIPLEGWKARSTVEMRAALGVGAFPSGRG